MDLAGALSHCIHYQMRVLWGSFFPWIPCSSSRECSHHPARCVTLLHRASSIISCGPSAVCLECARCFLTRSHGASSPSAVLRLPADFPGLVNRGVVSSANVGERFSATAVAPPHPETFLLFPGHAPLSLARWQSTGSLARHCCCPYGPAPPAE